MTNKYHKNYSGVYILMAYVISKTNGTVLGMVEDNISDSSLTSITLIGKAFKHYGQAFNNNLVAILENFADNNPPNAPLNGQLWYNASTETMSYYDGSSWVAIASSGWIYGGYPTNSQFEQLSTVLSQALVSSGFNTDGTRPNYFSTSIINNSQNLVQAISALDSECNTISNEMNNYITTNSLIGKYAPINSPNFIGTPTAPTPNAGDNSTNIATTAFVDNAITSSLTPYLTIAAAQSEYAPINSPNLTGTPTAPTPNAGDNSTNIATTAFVDNAINSSMAPYLTITAAQNEYAPINSPNLTGTPTAPTPNAGDNSTNIATTAFVDNAINSSLPAYLTIAAAQNEYAPINSPNLTGTPTVPTAVTGTSSSQIASVQFAKGTFFANTAGYYQIFPSGMIMQWGSSIINGSGGNAQTCMVNLPIPFPHSCVSTIVNEANPYGTWRASGNPTIYSAEIVSASQINVFGFVWTGSKWAVSDGIAFNWLAIGF